ncbi:MAG: hypothetical protein WC488_02605 [Candidatus Micrarchaeia archaeon]
MQNPEKGLKLINAAARWYAWGADYACSAYCADILLENKKVREAAEVHLRIGRATKDAKEAVKHFMEAAGIAKEADNNLAVKAYLFAINTAHQAFDEKSAWDAAVEAGKLLDGVGQESPHACEIGRLMGYICSEEMFVHFACKAGLETAMRALEKINDGGKLAAIVKFAKDEDVIAAALWKMDDAALIKTCEYGHIEGKDRLLQMSADALVSRISSCPPKALEIISLAGEEKFLKVMQELQERFDVVENNDGGVAMLAQCIAVLARIKTRTHYEQDYLNLTPVVMKLRDFKELTDKTSIFNMAKLLGISVKIDGTKSRFFEKIRLHEFLEQLERLAELPEDLGAKDWARNAPENGI